MGRNMTFRFFFLITLGGLSILLIGGFSISAEAIAVESFELSEIVLIVDVVFSGAAGVAGVEVAISVCPALLLLLGHLRLGPLDQLGVLYY